MPSLFFKANPPITSHYVLYSLYSLLFLCCFWFLCSNKLITDGVSFCRRPVAKLLGVVMCLILLEMRFSTYMLHYYNRTPISHLREKMKL